MGNSRAARLKKKKVQPAPEKIICTFSTPEGEPLPSPPRKSREFRILVQCLDKSGVVKRQAIFSELAKARGYIQIREACDALTAVPSVIELDPEVVGTWQVKIEVEPSKKAEGGSP